MPAHITYISQYITKQDMDVTKEQIKRLVDENLIKEANYKGYYVDIEIINKKK